MSVESKLFWLVFKVQGYDFTYCWGLGRAQGLGFWDEGRGCGDEP